MLREGRIEGRLRHLRMKPIVVLVRRASLGAAASLGLEFHGNQQEGMTVLYQTMEALDAVIDCAVAGIPNL